jgi:DNA-binding MarR family transcriptional regulator
VATRAESTGGAGKGPGAQAPPLGEPGLRAWRAVFLVHRRTIRETERRLAEAGLPPIGWYDALYTLYLAPDQRLSQHELAERMLVSPSGASRLVDRMVARDVVERCDRPGDRRSLNVLLTDEGIELMRRMWEVYGGVVAEFFAPAVAEQERQIAEALESAAEALERECPYRR